MKIKERFIKYLFVIIILSLAVLFVIKFGGTALLRAYIETGIGSCNKIPILCMSPSEVIIDPDIDREYRAQLLPYEFPKIKVYLPRGFSASQELIHKVYYKKRRPVLPGPAAYFIYEPPGFFINLFPDIKKQVKDDYEFLRRTMNANIKEISNITDAFFVVMKSIFIPDLAQQDSVHMAKFVLEDKRGFINYNLTTPDNYFDCNIFDKEGNFFKIYIKDRGAKLDLKKVFTIISTVRRP